MFLINKVQKMESKKQSTESKVKEIRRLTRKKYSVEEKIRIVIEGLRGESSIAVTLQS